MKEPPVYFSHSGNSRAAAALEEIDRPLEEIDRPPWPRPLQYRPDAAPLGGHELIRPPATAPSKESL